MLKNMLLICKNNLQELHFDNCSILSDSSLGLQLRKLNDTKI